MILEAFIAGYTTTHITLETINTYEKWRNDFRRRWLRGELSADELEWGRIVIGASRINKK